MSNLGRNKVTFLGAELILMQRGDPINGSWRASLKSVFLRKDGTTFREESALEFTDHINQPDPFVLTVLEALTTSVIGKVYDRGREDGRREATDDSTKG